MLEHIINVACDYPIKKEALTNKTLNFISNPKHKKSRKLYERYQKQYLDYCKKDAKRVPKEENIICNYFSMIAINDQYSSGTYWCMHSTLKKMILTRYQVDIKQYAVLKKLLKKLTQDHIAKKLDIFYTRKLNMYWKSYLITMYLGI